MAGTCNGSTPPGDGAEPVTDDAPGDGPGGLAECANPIPLALTASNVTGSLAGATDDFNPPMGGCSPTDGIEMVYAFDVVQNGTSITMSVKSPEVTGTFYMSSTCPPTSTISCGTITNSGGVSVSSSFNIGKAYLIIERGSGTGTEFVIRP